MPNLPLTKINYSDEQNPILSRAFSDVVGINYIKNSSFYDNIDHWTSSPNGGTISWDYSWLKIDPQNSNNFAAINQIDIPLGEYVIEFDLFNQNFSAKEMSIEFSNSKVINFDILNTSNIQRFKFNVSISSACNSLKIIANGKSLVKIKNVFLYHINNSSVLFKANNNTDNIEVLGNFVGKNVIEYDNFKNTQGYWRSNNIGNVQQVDDYLMVDSQGHNLVHAVTDCKITKGKYLLQIELLTTNIEPNGNLRIVLSNNQVKQFSVIKDNTLKQSILLDLVVTSDCDWIAIGSEGNNSFRLYQFYLSKKKSNVLEKIDKNESKIKLINDFVISADNLIKNGDFETSIEGWRAIRPLGKIDWKDGIMVVDSRINNNAPGSIVTNNYNYGPVYDINLSAGIYTVLIELRPTFLQGINSFFYILTSENETFSFNVENVAEKQQIIFEFLPSKNFNWFALIFSGEGRFELYNFKIYKKNNDIASEVINLQKQNIILGENIIKNSDFETSSFMWSADSGMTVNWVDSKLDITSTVTNSKLIYKTDLDAGKYIVSLEITPSILPAAPTRFFIVTGNDIKYFDVLKIATKQIFDLTIEVTAASENIALGFEGTGGFYLHNFYLFKKENNVISKLQSLQTPKSTTADITTQRTSANIIYNFLDQYTGEDIQAVETNEINSDSQVDNIIYFKSNENYYKRRYNYLTPEMYGAKGNGLVDDYIAIQKMLDSGEKGCTFWFDGSKTYYNAFANNGLWAEVFDRNMWQRRKSANFLFNGAKLRRRLPEWNDGNNKDNFNCGPNYTDDHTALLYLEGENFYIDKADFNSGINKNKLYNIKCIKKNINEECIEWKIYETNEMNYAVGSCMDMGLHLGNCKNVVINDSQFTNSVFPVYMENCENIVLNNPIFKYAAQAAKRLHSGDMALGGGIKLISCKNVQINNAYGYRNLNDTIEIEHFNENIFFSGISEYDYSNSVVIIDSQHVSFDWIAKYIQNGSGILIRGGKLEKQTKFISGRAIVDTCSWVGLIIILTGNAVNGIEGINIDLQTTNSGLTGLFVNNESSSNIISGININHTSKNDGAYSRRFHNICDGVCNGYTSYTSNTPNSKISTFFSGSNTSTKFMRFNILAGDGVQDEFSKENSAQAYKYQKVLYQDVL